MKPEHFIIDMENLITEIITRVNEHEKTLFTQQEINAHVGKAIRDDLEPIIMRLEKRLQNLESIEPK